MDSQMDSHGDSSIPPSSMLWGYKSPLRQKGRTKGSLMERFDKILPVHNYLFVAQTSYCNKIMMY